MIEKKDLENKELNNKISMTLINDRFMKNSVI